MVRRSEITTCTVYTVLTLPFTASLFKLSERRPIKAIHFVLGVSNIFTVKNIKKINQTSNFRGHNLLNRDFLREAAALSSKLVSGIN